MKDHDFKTAESWYERGISFLHSYMNLFIQFRKAILWAILSNFYLGQSILSREISGFQCKRHLAQPNTYSKQTMVSCLLTFWIHDYSRRQVFWNRNQVTAFWSNILQYETGNLLYITAPKNFGTSVSRLLCVVW